MRFISVSEEFFPELWTLQLAYKEEIGEEAPCEADRLHPEEALRQKSILFYGAVAESSLVAVCSVCRIFSTFNYRAGGVFEDFYIRPAYRHQGIARQLAAFAWHESGVSSLTVGCAPCDEGMYRAIGFRLPLGTLLAYEPEETKSPSSSVISEPFNAARP